MLCTVVIAVCVRAATNKSVKNCRCMGVEAAWSVGVLSSALRAYLQFESNICGTDMQRLTTICEVSSEDGTGVPP
eukprot:SAG31_NODE_3794_length_3876_cov_2.497485_4_plen_75_part_00